jgi:hypothetical protein
MVNWLPIVRLYEQLVQSLSCPLLAHALFTNRTPFGVPPNPRVAGKGVLGHYTTNGYRPHSLDGTPTDTHAVYTYSHVISDKQCV